MMENTWLVEVRMLVYHYGIQKILFVNVLSPDNNGP
ncbi:hypothetical protein A3Q56_07844 [Intoshia linei]|uniref:Uncharacterized protein n=1 Tax=Intoshia linei TaxID=1819745 RepID=A0A177ASC5_9BILA|nr:hypothetical protein A3Q56_07844 [Intoshia linei]